MSVYTGVDDEAREAIAESDDDESRQAEFIIPQILSGIFGPGGLLGGPRPPQPRPPLPSLPPSPVGPGVQSGTLTTPAGVATINLPSRVVSQDEFRQTTQRLEEAINRNTTRINTTQSDLTVVTQSVRAADAAVATARRDIGTLRREQAVGIARLRREQRSQASTNMLVGLLTQRQLQRSLEDHTHQVTVTATGTTPIKTTAATITDGDNTALMMLPLMLGSSDGGAGAGDNNMMMMMMMLMLAR